MKRILLAGPLVWASMSAAQAQEALPVLEEVIVTAQKRVENVQDIPMTINVVDGASIDHFSIRYTSDLADSVPGLVIQHTPQNLAQVAIRGLGTGSASERFALASIDGNWEVALLGKNLLDEESSFGFDFPFFGGQVVPAGSTTIGSLNRPRTLMLQGRYNF